MGAALGVASRIGDCPDQSLSLVWWYMDTRTNLASESIENPPDRLSRGERILAALSAGVTHLTGSPETLTVEPHSTPDMSESLCRRLSADSDGPFAQPPEVPNSAPCFLQMVFVKGSAPVKPSH